MLPRALHVINLARAGERLDAVLSSFDRHLAASGIALNRFAAIDAAEAERRNAPGALTWAEKACFLSHAASLAAAADARSPVWIVEDDVVFGPQTLARVEAALELLQGQPWDVLLTDLYVTDLNDMLELFRTQRRLAGEGKIAVLDLAGMAFAGSTSYLVNPAKVAELARRLAQYEVIDLAFDIWFKREAGAKRLRCHALFPFATTVADTPSQVQPSSMSRQLGWWNAYRMLLWEQTDPAHLDGILDRLDHVLTDKRSAQLGRIVGGILSEDSPRSS